MGRKYIKCPRCELNYILEGEDYCNICKSEMKHHAEGEDDGLLDNFDDMELCPVCGVNYIKEGQAMCEDCKKKKKSNGSDDGNDKDWKKTDDEDEDDDDMNSIRSDIDGDLCDEPYNSGFEEVDITADPYKVDDDPLIIDDDLGSSIDFSVEEDEDDELDIIDKSSSKDDFEVVEVSDDDDDEEDEDDYNDDDDDDDDFLGKRK